MPASDFVFALEVVGGASREMLNELVAQVLARAGGGRNGAGSLGDELHAAVAAAAARHPQPIGVRFSAAAGRLHVVVSSAGGAIWQTFRDAPPLD